MQREFNFLYEKYERLEEMNREDRELVRIAGDASGKAYAPYSKFRVGVAARLRSGTVISSSNQESEVFPAGICAERNLLFRHQSEHAGDPIVAMAIDSDPGIRECYPCGICRQTLLDSQNRQGSAIRVIMAGADSATVVDSAEKLMPFSFKIVQ